MKSEAQEEIDRLKFEAAVYKGAIAHQARIIEKLKSQRDGYREKYWGLLRPNDAAKAGVQWQDDRDLELVK